MLPQVHNNTIHPSGEVASNGVSSISVLSAFEQTVVPVSMRPIQIEEDFFERRLQYQGLQPLLTVEEVLVKRMVRAPQRLAIDEPSKYEILTTSGQLLFFVAERTEFFIQNTAFFSKPELIEFCLMSITGENILKLEVQPGCAGYLWSVTAKHREKTVGTVVQQSGCVSPYYLLQDSQKNELMKIKVYDRSEDCCICSVSKVEGCFSSSYEILPLDGLNSAGSICKECTEGKNNCQYDVHFPQDLDNGAKILLIASAIMMDLETYPGRIERRRKCDVIHFCSQFAASICCYILLVFIVILVVALVS